MPKKPSPPAAAEALQQFRQKAAVFDFTLEAFLEQTMEALDALSPGEEKLWQDTFVFRPHRADGSDVAALFAKTAVKEPLWLCSPVCHERRGAAALCSVLNATLAYLDSFVPENEYPCPPSE